MIFDMPQIPFEVYDGALNKTIQVVASCAKQPDAITMTFKSNDDGIAKVVMVTVDRGFNKPGIVRVHICRK